MHENNKPFPFEQTLAPCSLDLPAHQTEAADTVARAEHPSLQVH